MLKVTSVHFDPISMFFYLLMFIVVALNEEILMRGYVLINLMDSMNKYIALVVSSLLFSAMHLMNPNVSLVSVINLFLAGILLGIYFIHKGNLWCPIGMHLTWNFFQGPIFGFEVSGEITNSLIVQEITGPELLTGGKFGFEGSLLATVAIIVLTIVIHLKHKKVEVA
jgi:membrane protease YdiL (CAAX protease family)